MAKKDAAEDVEKILNSAAKIVVVDDSDFGRKSVVNILEDNGFNIVGQAESSEKLGEVLSKQDANLFLLDVVMPGQSGIELAKQINEKFRKAVIIMMSSLSQDHIIIESIATGAIDFLPKPFSADDLLNAVIKATKIIKSSE